MMNKAMIVDLVRESTDCTKTQAEDTVRSVFDSIIDCVKKGDEVSISGFGIFSSKARAARMGRNPRTGESIKIAASRNVKFKAAKAFKDAVAK